MQSTLAPCINHARNLCPCSSAGCGGVSCHQTCAWFDQAALPKFPLLPAAINVRAGTDVTSHDLRRTAATLMVSKAGVPREIVARVLNHTDRDATAIYIHASYDEPKREAWEAWSEYLITILTADIK